MTRRPLKKGQKLDASNIKTAITYKRNGILPKDYYNIINKKINEVEVNLILYDVYHLWYQYYNILLYL